MNNRSTASMSDISLIALQMISSTMAFLAVFYSSKAYWAFMILGLSYFVGIWMIALTWRALR